MKPMSRHAFPARGFREHVLSHLKHHVRPTPVYKLLMAYRVLMWTPKASFLRSVGPYACRVACASLRPA